MKRSQMTAVEIRSVIGLGEALTRMDDSRLDSVMAGMSGYYKLCKRSGMEPVRLKVLRRVLADVRYVAAYVKHNRPLDLAGGN